MQFGIVSWRMWLILPTKISKLYKNKNLDLPHSYYDAHIYPLDTTGIVLGPIVIYYFVMSVYFTIVLVDDDVGWSVNPAQVNHGRCHAATTRDITHDG